MRKHLLAAATATALLALALLAPSASAAPGTPVYSASGTYAPTCNTDVCFGGVNTYDYSGTATCSQNCANAPSSGTLQTTFHATRFFPPEPIRCVPKTVTGSFTFTPTDPNFPPQPIFASLSGHSRDRKALVASGTLTSGAFSGGEVSVLYSFPPSPCNPGSFTGAVTFYPPEPI
jgi:hypothetical protein